MPMDIQSGQVVWFEEDIGSLIGRAEIANMAGAIASSFSCGQGCQCSPSYSSSYLSPCPMPTSAVGDTMSCQALEMRTDCNNVSYGPYNRTTDSTWNSSNTAVATAAYGGSVSCVGAGTCSVYAQFSATIYTLNCFINTINPAPSCNMTVAPTISLGTVSFTSPNPPVIRLGETAHLRVNVTSTDVVQGTTVTLSVSQTNVSGGITINIDPLTSTVTLSGNQTIAVDVTFSPPTQQSPTLPITLNGHATLTNPTQGAVLAAGMGREKDSSNQLTIQANP